MNTIADVLEGRARWCVVHGSCEEVLPTVPRESVDVILTDPPYSAQVHGGVRSCRTRRVVDLGFEHLSAELRRLCAREFARVAKRWVGVFSDTDSDWLWRHSLEAAGLPYVRTAFWDRIGGAPQFTGDRPAIALEAITLAHRKGRKRWNGGGKRGLYSVPIVANRSGHRNDRIHTTQKPEELMLALVEDFTDPDEIVLDAFAGSGTTGAAALRRGRRFIGIERDETYAGLARERLVAEEQGLSLQAARAGQRPLFG